MPIKTSNYNLTKPIETDLYDIKVFNENVDIIDGELKKLNDSLSDSKMTFFKTDSKNSQFKDCNGGFLNIEEIQGKTLVNLFDKKTNSNYKVERDEFESTNEYLGFNIIDKIKNKVNSTFTIICDIKTTKDGYISFYSLGRYNIKVLKSSIETTQIKCTQNYQRVAFSFNIQYGDKSDPNGENCILSFYGTYDSGIKPVIKNIMLLEDDWVYSLPNYFEGLYHVGQYDEALKAYKIEFLSSNKNLVLNSNFQKQSINNTIGWDNLKNSNSIADYWSSGYNPGVENPTQGYHAHINTSTFNYPVIRY